MTKTLLYKLYKEKILNLKNFKNITLNIKNFIIRYVLWIKHDNQCVNILLSDVFQRDFV